MREQKQVYKEFYENEKQEEDANDANKPAYFRPKKAIEPASQDLKLDEDRPLSKKAEDAKAWANL
jgi:hypothetical protein